MKSAIEVITNVQRSVRAASRPPPCCSDCSLNFEPKKEVSSSCLRQPTNSRGPRLARRAGPSRDHVEQHPPREERARPAPAAPADALDEVDELAVASPDAAHTRCRRRPRTPASAPGAGAASNSARVRAPYRAREPPPREAAAASGRSRACRACSARRREEELLLRPEEPEEVGLRDPGARAMSSVDVPCETRDSRTRAARLEDRLRGARPATSGSWRIMASKLALTYFAVKEGNTTAARSACLRPNAPQSVLELLRELEECVVTRRPRCRDAPSCTTWRSSSELFQFSW